jgi:molybdate transport system substrate-binding protein
MKPILAALLVGFGAISSNVTFAGATDLNVLASNSLKAVVAELAPQFEKETGHRLVFTWDTANNLVKQIEGGQTFDVVIVTPAQVNSLSKLGKVEQNSPVNLTRAGLGVAVKQGAPRPDISTVEAFKQTLLNARAVAYVTSGQSGVYFIGVVEKLGIADQIKAKAKTALGGSAAEFVAKGEADIAIQVIPELISASGVEVVGPFPPELQIYIGLTGGIGVDARDKAASQAFLEYLTTPAAISVIKAKGMEPG